MREQESFIGHRFCETTVPQPTGLFFNAFTLVTLSHSKLSMRTEAPLTARAAVVNESF